MRLYLDTCILISLFTTDVWSPQAWTLLGSHVSESHVNEVLVSDFANLEFASATARLVRMHKLTEHEAREAFLLLDRFIIRLAARVETSPADLKAAEIFLRPLALPLRAGDALNIAIAERLGAVLATFDRKMAEAARALGVDVAGDQPTTG